MRARGGRRLTDRAEAVALLERYASLVRDEAAALGARRLQQYRDHDDALLHENGDWSVHYLSLEGSDTSAQRVPSLTALGALEGFGPDLPEFSGLLLPPMVALVADASPGSRTLLETLEALRVLSARARTGRP